MLGDPEDVEAKLGYIPKTVLEGPVSSVHSISCKIWHSPSSLARKDNSDRIDEKNNLIIIIIITIIIIIKIIIIYKAQNSI